jgi:hypothetical protein
MDRILAHRLDTNKDVRARLVKLAKDYLRIGRDALAYWSSDFDICYDILSCYSPMTKKDIEALERSHPKRYILPMTATQITTMTTYIAQVLFGQDTPWKVEGRRPEDDVPAELVNNLLRWNAEQQPTYLLGYLWVQDALAINRGIFYNSWAPIFKPAMVEVPVADPKDLDEMGQPRTYMRPTRKNKVVGSYCKMEIVSPYDFICDPALPMHRLNDGRFCGHRTIIAVTELRRRSKLPIDHPQYVLPSAVEDLVAKAKKGIAQADAAVPSLPGVLPNPAEIRLSRTAYERTRALQPTGNVQADKNDTGNVECWELWVRLVPSENRIYSDETPTPASLSGGTASPTGAELNNSAGYQNPVPPGMSQPGVPPHPGSTSPSVANPDQGLPNIVEPNVARTKPADDNPAANQDFTQEGITDDEPVIFQILIAGGDVLLSVNESTYEHGMYPYSTAEGRPSAHFQFSVSWIQMLKGIQDYVDWLKSRHQEALSRTVGNIFVYDPTAVDVTDFMNPDKEGLLITLKPEAMGKKISDIFQQVPIKDLTENFMEEAMTFVKYSQSVTAADEGMQGVMPGGEPASATQFAGTQQMGAGRMTSIARLLSSQALVPQTKMMVSMFQQFLDQAQAVRFKPSDPMNLPPELQDAASVSLSKDAIAGEYDFPAHDGTLPGTDGRKVAAITRLLEAAQGFPQCFAPAPGNINPKKLLMLGAKASGLQIENFLYDKATLPPTPPPGATPNGPPGGPPPIGAPTLPGAAPAAPAGPPGIPQNPGPQPALPTLSPLAAPVLPPIGPTQPRPV